ncbi:MAG: type II toxin-antitoxin system ParD family antitoxin [Thermomicrobiales bacterium]|nr:type II toxin-antitoxin system ParD family antitoxin [Thermomicrobiales bacterium]
MNVSLTPQLEAMIRAKVDSGMYNNASEVVREALRIMEREEKRRILMDALQEGVDQIERGETIEYTSSTMQDALARARANLAAGHQVSDLVKP